MSRLAPVVMFRICVSPDQRPRRCTCGIDLVFHTGWGEPSLEMREFSEQGLKDTLTAAGFTEVRFHGEDQPGSGILQAEAWSLPVAARKGPFVFSRDAARDVVREWGEYKRRFTAEMTRLHHSYWYRIGRRLRLL